MKSALLVFSLVMAATAPADEKYIGLNFGTSSKSMLGLSYQTGRNAFNFGMMGVGVNRHGSFGIQPGITYHRYFGDAGWYGALGYSVIYKQTDGLEINSSSPFIDDWEYQQEAGWKSSEILVGVGKNIQWASWGFNVDGGLALSGGNEFAKPLGFRVGLGGSYRFKLD
jgi:hypothetical protein